MKRPTVAISMGDPFGIGPEVLVAALADPRVRRACLPRVFGDESVLRRAAAARKLKLPPAEIVSLTALAEPGFRFGRPTAAAGRASIAYLNAAIDSVKAGDAAALCTAPINKAQVLRAGFRHAGHTEFLRERFGVKRVVMMLAGPTLRVALATVHLPLKKVPTALTKTGLEQDLAIIERALRQDFGIKHPHIAVCGLNPHAGEEGTLGDEEIKVIGPAIASMRRRGLRVEGPFPADALFARAVRHRVGDAPIDAILAMTHDQGLGPLKAVDFERAINVTLGLPYPRTSPDHGTAHDIAGKGVADATSMTEALLWAARLAR